MDKTFDVFNMALKLAPLFLGYKQQSQPSTILTEKDLALINLRNKDGAVIVVLGTRDTGKTELCYRLAEFLGKPTYAVSPEQKPHPDWIKRIDIENLDEMVMPHSTVILDDVPIYLSSKDYGEALNRALEKIIPMVRHERKWHMIFSSQNSAQADRYILDCDAAFLKPLGLLMGAVERPNIARIYKMMVDPEFDGKDDHYIQRHAFFLSRTFRGIIKVKKVD